MKIISELERKEWLSKRLQPVNLNDVTDYKYSVTYHLPEDSGKKTALARAMTHSIEDSQPGLFWITAWGIFPSSENVALFDGYRRSLGEVRPIHEAPGHIFDTSDLRDLECLCDLALYFYWDASLFDGMNAIMVRTSHDETISIHARDKVRLGKLVEGLQGLKLRQLNQV